MASLVPLRYYTSNALATTLAASLGPTGNPSVNSVAGMPASFPFTVLIDWGLASQEAISVTSAPTGTGPFTLPCTRGIDGSTGGAGGISHNAGAVVVHGVTAQDFAQPVNYVSGVSSFPWQFNVASPAYGAVGNGQMIGDGSITASSAILTTPGLSAPAAPTVNNAGTGGTVLAGTYGVIVTYVNKNGETLGSSSTSTTTSGSTSTITITTPAFVSGATGWYAYVTQAGGVTYTRQQTAGQPSTVGVNLVLTAPPSSGGANPPGGNTSQSNPFTTADVGKAIMIKGAAVSGVTTLVTTISAFTNSGQVTLATTAATSVSNAVVMWATDDTAAFQAAVNAAVTYAQANSQYAEVLVPPSAGAFYGIAGALSHANKGNAQITLPVIGTNSPCLTLVIRGSENSSALRHWQQVLPQAGGSCLVSFGCYTGASSAAAVAAQASDLGANGQSACIGGPTGPNGYGTGTVVYSNMMLVMRDLDILTTHCTSGVGYGAVWAWGQIQHDVQDCGYGTIGMFAESDFSTPSGFGSGASIGWGFPANGNQNNLSARGLECGGGYAHGLFATEHLDIQNCTIFYCWAGLTLVGSFADNGASSAAATHKIVATEVGIEGCTFFLYIYGPGSAGRGPKIKASLDIESAAPTISGSSATAMADALGEITVSGTYTPGNITVTNPVSLIIIDAEQQPVAATTWTLVVGTAFKNPAWRWANVWLTGGTSLTTVAIGATFGTSSAPSMNTVYSQSAGALPLVPVRIPPGGWIQVSGSGSPTAPTANVTYD